MNHEHQAAAFLNWHRRRGGDFDSDFVLWSTSKDFHPSDARAIREIVHAELVARCDAVVTDLEFVP